VGGGVKQKVNDSPATRMRAAFDRSFAEPPAGEAEPVANYLGIRIGPAAFAVALDEIGSVFADKRVSPLPSAAPEMLGVAGVRGDTVPIFSLAALLGAPSGDASPRWLVLAAGGRAGFAFDTLDGHLRIPVSDVTAATTTRGFVQANAVIAGEPRPIVSIASLVEHLERRAGHSAAKEQ
jgi:chemotaxis signal transduction protein